MSGLRYLITFVSIAVMMTGFAGCASADNAGAPGIKTGTVEFLDIEGGCWIIRTDDGRALSPINLPPSVRQHGLRVSFTASAEPGVVTICMAGEPVRILSIEPLSKKPVE